MRQTYCIRRKEILENPIPLSDLFMQCPPLKDPDEVSNLYIYVALLLAIHSYVYI